ncbi:hypothetical protein PR048_013521 [Dryococelus australis]|uniref:Uncharacterized protein n=1 Tax=Dryococelus australis TaxID=614101 RepID=A0ABQ9HSJ5_9NEOP|nr:hypothetical protein PR048_013521 [Dryococelus australis]
MKLMAKSGNTVNDPQMPCQLYSSTGITEHINLGPLMVLHYSVSRTERQSAYCGFTDGIAGLLLAQKTFGSPQLACYVWLVMTLQDQQWCRVHANCLPTWHPTVNHQCSICDLLHHGWQAEAFLYCNREVMRLTPLAPLKMIFTSNIQFPFQGNDGADEPSRPPESAKVPASTDIAEATSEFRPVMTDSEVKYLHARVYLRGSKYRVTSYSIEYSIPACMRVWLTGILEASAKACTGHCIVAHGLNSGGGISAPFGYAVWNSYPKQPIATKPRDNYPLYPANRRVAKVLVHAAPVDDVGTLRNRIEAGCETIRNFPGIRQRIRVSMRIRTVVYRRPVECEADLVAACNSGRNTAGMLTQLRQSMVRRFRRCVGVSGRQRTCWTIHSLELFRMLFDPVRDIRSPDEMAHYPVGTYHRCQEN